MMSPRKWLAWKLVRISYRIYDAEWIEVITAKTAAGHDIHIEVVGDEYGCGISSMSGIPWNVTEDVETAELDGWTLTWHEPVRYKDTLTEDDDE